MKVLVVCSFNSGRISPFISEPTDELKKLRVSAEYFLVEGKGIKGYLMNLIHFKHKIDTFKPDLIHAHYGLSGLLANFQRKKPVITTFHGSDINIWYIRPFSILASLLSGHSIFISRKLAKKSFLKGKYSIIPSGTSLETFFPMAKPEARDKLRLPLNEKIILFAGAINNRIKNYPLAMDAIRLLGECRLMELKNYSREEVNLLLNASDVALMTSLHEGSPQFIKEAMACNRPVVSTDVGDVKEVMGPVDGCFIAEADKDDIALKLRMAMKYEGTANGRQRIIELGMDLETVSRKILEVYSNILKSR